MLVGHIVHETTPKPALGALGLRIQQLESRWQLALGDQPQGKELSIGPSACLRTSCPSSANGSTRGRFVGPESMAEKHSAASEGGLNGIELRHFMPVV